jgi:hypothetical protein
MSEVRVGVVVQIWVFVVCYVGGGLGRHGLFKRVRVRRSFALWADRSPIHPFVDRAGIVLSRHGLTSSSDHAVTAHGSSAA